MCSMECRVVCVKFCSHGVFPRFNALKYGSPRDHDHIHLHLASPYVQVFFGPEQILSTCRRTAPLEQEMPRRLQVARSFWLAPCRHNSTPMVVGRNLAIKGLAVYRAILRHNAFLVDSSSVASARFCCLERKTLKN